LKMRLFYIKETLKKYKIAIIAYCIYQNYKAKRKIRTSNFETSSGSHFEMTAEKSVEYARKVFQDYLFYARLKIDFIKDKSVLEVGPGDNFAVALQFLIHGAKKVVCVDRFFSKRDEEKNHKVYELLREPLKGREAELFDQAVTLQSDGIPRFNPEKFAYVYGKGIEEASSALPDDSFDLIVSRAVLEHVYDIDAALESMTGMMKNGCYQIHKIDLRDHGMFSGSGMHPLTFLTIPAFLWKRMTFYTGGLNRNLIDYYRKKMKELKLDARFYITSVLGRDAEITPHKDYIQCPDDYSEKEFSSVSEIRPKLIRRYRNLESEDLLVSVIFLVAVQQGQSMGKIS
jgi:methyltransferase family protein